ncbi:FecR domain-containing protein [Parapedobacter sp. ISTM3]|uniref:FecR family protein n=1 Tax=Parapedobacter sp. ISTM3 TaxID=2800130 RepID=UPI001904C9D5|nr:FecR domain-containing protein [Parapedobacter sp. ISTM3]MBK1440716.1 FecR domain-containing protein [Parapedobacter sp. ISTM3]
MSDQQLLAYIRGELSQEETDSFLDWIEASPDHRARYRLIRNAWDLVILSHSDDMDSISADQAYRMLKTRMGSLREEVAEDKRRTWNISGIAKIAAAILLAVAASWYFLRHRSDTIGYHHIEVSVGQRVKLVLADSTIVWLAAGSEFTYPERFDRQKRYVVLNGEAQFHVATDKQRPFEVETATHTVSVLGTEFNVYAYDEASHFETTLYAGSVSIRNHQSTNQNIQLQPGQKLSYDKGRASTRLQHDIDSTEMVDRIEGYLIFNKTPFSDMAERLSRYYQKPIRIKDPGIASYECTGKFHYQEKLEKILEVVRAGRPFGYKITDHEVEIFAQD